MSSADDLDLPAAPHVTFETAYLLDPRWQILNTLKLDIQTATNIHFDFYDLQVEYAKEFDTNFKQFLNIAKLEVLKRVAFNSDLHYGEMGKLVRLFNDPTITLEFYNGRGMRTCNLFIVSILKKDWASANELVDLGVDFWSVTPWKSAPWMIVAKFGRITLLYKMFLRGAVLEPKELDAAEYNVQEYAGEHLNNLKELENLYILGWTK